MSFVHGLRLGPRRILIDVHPDINYSALAGRDALARLVQRRANLAGLAHGNAPTAKAFGKFFEIDVTELVADTTSLWPVFADLAAADLVHRGVVADHGNIRQREALRR